MRRLTARLRLFGRHAGGATAMEYGLILALLSVIVIAAVTTTGSAMYGVLNNLSARIAGH